MQEIFESQRGTFLRPQLFTLEAQKPKLRCTGQNQAQLTCISKNCQASALICVKQACECLQKHNRCQIIRLDRILNSINKNAYNKKNQISNEARKSFEAIRLSINDMIDQLSQIREELSSQQMYFGLQTQEIAFMKSIIEQQTEKISGKSVRKLKKALKKEMNFILDGQQKILQDFEVKRKEFDSFCKLIEQKMVKKDLNKGIFSDSKIIKQTNQSAKLSKWLSEISNKTGLKSKLLFRASQHKFSAKQFHKHCNGIRNTVVIVKTEFDKVIGGFTPKIWHSETEWVKDETGTSFIFSLTLLKKYKCINPQKSIYCNQIYGPRFGDGADIHISDNCNDNTNSYSSFPYSYNNREKQQGIKKSSVKLQRIRTSFCGATDGNHFKVKQYEVYEIEGMQEEVKLGKTGK